MLNIDSEWSSLLLRADEFIRHSEISCSVEWRKKNRLAQNLVSAPVQSPSILKRANVRISQRFVDISLEGKAARTIQALVRGWIQRLHFNSWVQMMACVESERASSSKCSAVRSQRDGILQQNNTLDAAAVADRRRANKEEEQTAKRLALNTRRQQILDRHRESVDLEHQLSERHRRQQLLVNQQVVRDRGYVKNLITSSKGGHNSRASSWHSHHLKRCVATFSIEREILQKEPHINL